MRVFGALLAIPVLLSAAPQKFISGSTRTHLLELFTSEGCSSCPPAEDWLTQLRAEPAVWRDFVPIAWHVDYWDHLGWKDRFASKEATARQSAYARQWGSSSVYTPCFVLDGREWRRSETPRGSADPAGVLRARYDGRTVLISFTAAPGAPRRSTASRAPTDAPYEGHAVLLALGVVSKVTAGENRGRNLHHDFIAATSLRSAALQPTPDPAVTQTNDHLRPSGATEARTAPSSQPFTGTIDLSASTAAGTGELALAVWITRPGDATPIQATGGMLGPAPGTR